MPEYKNQHYVPRFYLKKFSPDQKRIYVYDKALNRSLGLLGINSVASKSFFYDFPAEIEEKHIQEKEFQRFEHRFNKVINLVIDVANGATADSAARIDMSLCVTLQLLRTFDFRESVADFYEKAAAALMESAFELVKPELLSDFRLKANFSDDAISVLHAELIWDSTLVADVASTLANRIWVIGRNKTGIPLYTSDAPVVMKSHKEKPLFIPNPNVGPDFAKAVDIVIELDRPAIKEEGVEIAFPLNSECILIILENSYFEYLKDRNGMVYNLQPEDVARYNTLQVTESNRQIYSMSDDFKLLEELCAKNPDLCSAKRERNKVEKWRWSKEI